jgi:hypothetical protein
LITFVESSSARGSRPDGLESDGFDPDFQKNVHAHFTRVRQEVPLDHTDVPFDYPDRRAHSGTGRRI